MFTGDDENDNKQMGDHARNMRKLCDLPGRPCVVALCHPTKRPSGTETCCRAAAAPIIAEVDGNLSLWAHDDKLADLHWTGKFRGPDFEKITFRLDTITTTSSSTARAACFPP